MTKEINTSCLCGAVKINIKNSGSEIGACHCNMCRKWSGSPYLAVDCGTEVLFEGQDNITIFDSSEWAQRGFCSQCGTHLYYRLKKNQQYMMPAGLLDKDHELSLKKQIFIDRKPAYYNFSNETIKMTADEVFAVFSTTDD